jgi:EAL domain-containing protein (putative c-di-GMP-specific phosphodiesterase class I)
VASRSSSTEPFGRPVDELKIDRSFVSDLLHSRASRLITTSTIELAHALGLRVVAEGVEDAATQQALAELGCDLVQGYHLGRPAPVGRLIELLCAHPAAEQVASV